MAIVHIIEWLQETRLIGLLGAANQIVVVVTEVCHVLGLVSLLAAVVLINLRLFGVVLNRQPLALVARATGPMLWGGLGVTLLSGSVLFLSGPVRYYYNPAFQPKIGLLLLALLVQWTLYRKAAGTVAPGPLLARAGAALSLTLWFSVGLCGRAIGYI